MTLINYGENVLRIDNDKRHIDVIGNIENGWICFESVNFGVFRIDRINLARVAVLEQTFHDI